MILPVAVLLVCFGDNGPQEYCCALTFVTSQLPNKTANIKENEAHRHRASCIFLGRTKYRLTFEIAGEICVYKR